MKISAISGENHLIQNGENSIESFSMKKRRHISELRIRITNANPDPSFHLTADSDLVFHFNVDPELDPAPHQSDANRQPLVNRPSWVPF
jgi:hypothetical protein